MYVRSLELRVDLQPFLEKITRAPGVGRLCRSGNIHNSEGCVDISVRITGVILHSLLKALERLVHLSHGEEEFPSVYLNVRVLGAEGVGKLQALQGLVRLVEVHAKGGLAELSGEEVGLDLEALLNVLLGVLEVPLKHVKVAPVKEGVREICVDLECLSEPAIGNLNLSSVHLDARALDPELCVLVPVVFVSHLDALLIRDDGPGEVITEVLADSQPLEKLGVELHLSLNTLLLSELLSEPEVSESVVVFLFECIPAPPPKEQICPLRPTDIPSELHSKCAEVQVSLSLGPPDRAAAEGLHEHSNSVLRGEGVVLSILDPLLLPFGPHLLSLTCRRGEALLAKVLHLLLIYRRVEGNSPHQACLVFVHEVELDSAELRESILEQRQALKDPSPLLPRLLVGYIELQDRGAIIKCEINHACLLIHRRAVVKEDN
mmetsp:Transcript_9697/g.19736  ORF Transcript_9697/g.19736 Transcript_9697/m.19736 type:complete len:433 (-) Transcript_9697:445-1743(-)